MNTTRSATLRAKPISWVTTIIVMPSCASSTITSSTSLIISGSRADVGSSNSIAIGSMASARLIATRCCWPPDSWPGNFSICGSRPTRLIRASALALASSRDRPRTFCWPRHRFSRTLICG
mmetsp:Transcript_2690/g.3220  ORF Transcript_2690/g.3220 Transcript_2690/m.3220 type:complete len:121 (-) Transcript_2690:947-1309(-)